MSFDEGDFAMQPLSRVKPHTGLHFFPPSIMTARPKVAHYVAEALAQWANIECSIGVLLAIILDEEAQTGLAMFYSLNSSNNQIGLVEAAKVKLTKADQELISAFLSVARSAAKQRHKLAHWCWLLTDELPDDLLLTDPSHQSVIMANMLGYHDVFAEVDRSKIFVLRASDLKAIVKRFREVWQLLSQLIGVMHQQDRGKRAEARRRLSTAPVMAEALQRLRQKNTQEPRQSPPDEELTEVRSAVVRARQRAQRHRKR